MAKMSQMLPPIRKLAAKTASNSQIIRTNMQRPSPRLRLDLLLPYWLLYGGLAAAPLTAQEVPRNLPNPIEPIQPQLPSRPLLPPPEELLQTPRTTTPNNSTGDENTGPPPESIHVQRFEVVGSRVFDEADFQEVLSPYTDRPLSFAELLQARTAITEFYKDKGYITSGAFIPPQRLSEGVVQIQVVEGQVEEVNVSGNNRLSDNYISKRLALGDGKALNVNDLLTSLQMLQLNPLIDTLSAELSAGSSPGMSVLDVRIKEAPAFRTSLSIDNGRSPSVSTFRQQASIGHDNLFGFGDSFRANFTNTEGSKQWEFNYGIPINARNGTLSFNYSTTDSEIIEPPFDRVDIQAESRNYELTLRQPLIQTPTREFTMGLTGSRRRSQTSLLGVNFPLSRGASDNGVTKLSVLRWFQEFTQRDNKQVFAMRSQFSLGTGWLDATVNSSEPDSRFFAWRGQAQWLRVLAPATVLLLRSDIQLSPTELVPLEQFGLGGFETVRGYRQDALLTDNGAFASAELRIPLYRSQNNQMLLQVAPFFDIGTAWNSDNAENPEDNTLASVGLGLRFQLGDSLTARIDYGYPLIDINSRDRTWQENGFYFSLQANPF